MMGGKCKCPHHYITMVLGILGALAGIGYFYTLFISIRHQLAETLLGMSTSIYFTNVVVLGFMVLGTKMCACCCGDRCCEVCPVNKGGHHKMEGPSEGGM